jgi:hypothetical protein
MKVVLCNKKLLFSGTLTVPHHGICCIDGSANIIVRASGGQLESFHLSFGLHQDYAISLTAAKAWEGDKVFDVYKNKAVPRVKLYYISR